MPSSIRIRASKATDVDTIVEFNRALAAETENLVLSEQTLRRGVEAVLEDSDRGLYFVAERDGSPAGQIMVTYEWSDWRNGWLWWIQSVYVAEPFRRCGVFRALYEHVRELAIARRDVAGLRLYVFHANERAMATYRSLGMHAGHYRFFEADLSLPSTTH